MGKSLIILGANFQENSILEKELGIENFTVLNKYLNLSGVVVDGSSSNTGGLYDLSGLIQAGYTKLKIQYDASQHGSQSAYIAFLTSNSLVTGQIAPFATGTTQETISQDAEFDIPDGTVYLYSSLYFDGVERFVDSMLLY